MILCSCNVITRAIIIETAQKLAAERPGRPVTPAQVFRELKVKAQCTVCFPVIRAVFVEAGLPFTCPEPLATEADLTERGDRSAEVVRFDRAKRMR
jgi:bacterioferritin-associated ferredoxin